MTNRKNVPIEDEIQWPNQKEVVDGVTPANEVSQDPNLFDDDPEEDLVKEMEE